MTFLCGRNMLQTKCWVESAAESTFHYLWIKSQAKFLYPRADRSYITPSLVFKLLMRLLQRLAPPSPSLLLWPLRPPAPGSSSLSGRTRKDQCKPHHLPAIYTSLAHVHFCDPSRVHRGQWKETVGCFSPFAPPHRAALSSLLPTRLNHRLRPLQLTESKIDNKVSGMKNWWPVVGTGAPQLQVDAAKCRERRLGRQLHVSGTHWRAREEHRQPRVPHEGVANVLISWNIQFPLKGKWSYFVHF